MSSMRCYVCARHGCDIANDRRAVFLEDDSHQTVYVGRTCYKKVQRAGNSGVQSKNGGPRVFFTFDQAAKFASDAKALADQRASSV
jgi:hypothetical protein